MKIDAAMTHLAAYREGKVTDPRLSKALRCIENESLQRGRLAEQVAFDISVMEMLGAIRSPEDLRQRLNSAKPALSKTPARPQHHLTAVVAVGLGVAIIIAVLIFFQMQARQNFAGRESLMRILSSTKSMSGAAEMEPVVNAAGELGDWFYVRNYEGYVVPPELQHAPAVGARLFRQDGHPVAQVAIDAHQSLIYVFKAGEFGVELPSPEEWTVFSSQGWAAAAKPYGDSVVMLTFLGTEDEMRAFLPTLKP